MSPRRGKSNRSKTVDEIVADLDSRGLLDLAVSVANRHHVSLEEMLSRGRTPLVVRPRDHLLHAIRSIDPELWSYPEIGGLFGVEHTTVMAAVRRHWLRTAPEPSSSTEQPTVH